MFDHLQIVYPRERALVGLADSALAPLAWFRRSADGPVRRILLLRLERIGDLIMVLDAIRDARAAWPDAEIDLAVGSWNAPLAALIRDITHVELVDVPWLARGGSRDSWPALVSRARGWAQRGYDLVVNFEPDIRSNALAWLTGAPRRVGYASGGGRAFLTDARVYEPGSHVAVNARDLIAHAAGRKVAALRSGDEPRLILPEAAVSRARAALGKRRGRSSACMPAADANPNSGISNASRPLPAGSPRRAAPHSSSRDRPATGRLLTSSRRA